MTSKSKGIVYYTDGRLDQIIHKAVRRQLETCVNTVDGLTKIVSVTIDTPDWDFGRWLKLDHPRGVLTMFKQILHGLESISTDYVFLCEHDVLYHPSHFAAESEGLTYNQHVWKVNAKTGHALHYPCSQVSGLSGPTDILLNHYKTRVALVEASGFSMKMGYEPGTHTRPERVDDLSSTTWMSRLPNIDIRHDTNLSPTRWSKSEFRNPKFTVGWTESDEIPGWGTFHDFMQELH